MTSKAKAKNKVGVELDNPALHRALAAEADERGRSVQEIVEEVLNDWLHRWEVAELRKSGGSLMDLPLAERLRLLGANKAPTEKELEARREWGKWAEEFRERVGPIDIRTGDLVHMTPEEVDEKYGSRPDSD